MRNGAAGLLSWLHTFRRDTPASGAGVSLGWAQREQREERVCVSDVVDIEESVWAPRYGLKGMVDASVELSFDSAALPARAAARAPAMLVPSAVLQSRCPCAAFLLQPSFMPQQAANAEGATAGAARLLRMLAPLEFKTGKAHQSHRAQVPRALSLSFGCPAA